MYIDAGETLRVRVESDEFCDDEPGPPKAAEGVMIAKAERRRPPYTIVVSNSISCTLPLHFTANQNTNSTHFCSFLSLVPWRLSVLSIAWLAVSQVFHRRTGSRSPSVVEIAARRRRGRCDGGRLEIDHAGVLAPAFRCFKKKFCSAPQIGRAHV